MWIMMNDSFLSIVAHRDKPGMLLVRARHPEHIRAVFPGVDTWIDDEADYPFRAEVSRGHVSAVIAKQVGDIDYPNFKNSVRDKGLYAAYTRVWEALCGWGSNFRRRARFPVLGRRGSRWREWFDRRESERYFWDDLAGANSNLDGLEGEYDLTFDRDITGDPEP
tara:strand:- start:9906 stop:10400 length:495 start_codon:yes stop_codon:yes gene_type:complete